MDNEHEKLKRMELQNHLHKLEWLLSKDDMECIVTDYETLKTAINLAVGAPLFDTYNVCFTYTLDAYENPIIELHNGFVETGYKMYVLVQCDCLNFNFFRIDRIQLTTSSMANDFHKNVLTLLDLAHSMNERAHQERMNAINELQLQAERIRLKLELETQQQAEKERINTEMEQAVIRAKKLLHKRKPWYLRFLNWWNHD